MQQPKGTDKLHKPYLYALSPETRQVKLAFNVQLVGQRWAQLSAEQKAAWSAKAAAMRRSERGGGGAALSSADDGAAPAILSLL